MARDNKGTIGNPDRISNFDETTIDCTLDRLQQVFIAAGMLNGGAQGVKSACGMCKHITAAIMASAA